MIFEQIEKYNYIGDEYSKYEKNVWMEFIFPSSVCGPMSNFIITTKSENDHFLDIIIMKRRQILGKDILPIWVWSSLVQTQNAIIETTDQRTLFLKSQDFQRFPEDVKWMSFQSDRSQYRRSLSDMISEKKRSIGSFCCFMWKSAIFLFIFISVQLI